MSTSPILAFGALNQTPHKVSELPDSGSTSASHLAIRATGLVLTELCPDWDLFPNSHPCLYVG